MWPCNPSISKDAGGTSLEHCRTRALHQGRHQVPEPTCMQTLARCVCGGGTLNSINDTHSTMMPCRRGDFVCEFYGMLVLRGCARPEAANYALGLNEKYQIDPVHPLLPKECRLVGAMNHSCQPNVIVPSSDPLAWHTFPLMDVHVNKMTLSRK